MQRRQHRAAARRALDAKLALVDLHALAPPPSGWVRAIRDALGMSTRQLAARMGVAAMSVSNLEQSERAGTIQLNTLRRAADALDCDVAYVLVPRLGGLDHTVRRRAQLIARREIERVDRTMRLEDQGVAGATAQERIDEFAAHLVDTSSIWDSSE